jgi:hypothetical protein
VIIAADKDGTDAVNSLVDTFLKVNGIGAINGALQILQSIQGIDKYTDEIRNKCFAEIKEREDSLKCEAGEVEI